MPTANRKTKAARIQDIKSRTDISKETKQVLLDLENQLYNTETLNKLITEQNTHIRNSPCDSNQKSAKRKTSHFLIFLCKLLYPVFNIGGFLFMIAGGIHSISCVFTAWEVYTSLGWYHLLISKSFLTVVIYVLLMLLINRVRFYLYKTLHNI